MSRLFTCVVLITAYCFFAVNALKQCDVKFKLCDETSINQKTIKTKISGYYWRPYTGIIPSDAIPCGRTKLYNVTYIGLVYDPVNRGEFPVNIYPAQKEAVVFKNETSVRASHIQIFCSQEKKNLEWVKIGDETTTGGDLPDGGHSDNDAFPVLRTKTMIGEIYAGQVQISNKYESWPPESIFLYTKSTGQPGLIRTTEFSDFEALVYLDTAGNPQKAEEDGSADYSIDTTNDYYWRPKYTDSVPKDALSIGTRYNNNTKTVEQIYVGQVYNTNLNEMSQGSFSQQEPSATFIYQKSNGKSNIKVLCTSNKDALKWVRTTLTDVPKLFPKAVLGGYTNISAVYVSRFIRNNNDTFEGRLFALGDKGTPTFVYNDDDVVYTDETEFELLTYEGPLCFQLTSDTVSYVNMMF